MIPEKKSDDEKKLKIELKISTEEKQQEIKILQNPNRNQKI